MRRVDARAIHEHGIPGLTLMEAAGSAVAESIAEEIPDVSGRRVVVRLRQGKQRRRRPGRRAPSRAARDRRHASSCSPAAPSSRATRRPISSARRRPGVTIEEIEGDDGWSRARRRSSIATPSSSTRSWERARGAERAGRSRGPSTRSTSRRPRSWRSISRRAPTPTPERSTGPRSARIGRLTLCRPKPCLVLEPAASHAGPWRVLDIGIPDEAVAAEPADLEWLDADAAARLDAGAPRRRAQRNDGPPARGRREPRENPARPSSWRARPSGPASGSSRSRRPRAVQPIVAAAQAEIMTEPLLVEAARPTRRSRAHRPHATRWRSGPGSGRRRERAPRSSRDPGRTIGPGRSRRGRSQRVRRGPADADARLRAGRAPARSHARTPARRPACSGTTAAEVQADRLGRARRLAAATGAIVVLKGRRTVVAHPDGRAAVQRDRQRRAWRPAERATRLTGILGALLARGLSGFDAARLGTYVHGDAGDLAAARFGEDGLIAGDLIDALPEAWRRLAVRRRGVTRWTRGA